MERLRDANTIDDLPPLIKIIVQGWKRHSPVDCLIISSELELMGRQPVNELPSRNKPAQYHFFLSEALEGKRPGVGEKTSPPLSSSRWVVIDRIQSAVEVLDTFRYAPASQNATVIRIDTTAFENGGTLTIDIQVGRAALVGSFDLLPDDSALPTDGTPQNALAQAWGIQPGETEQSLISLTRDRSFNSVPLAVGSIRKEAPTLFEPESLFGKLLIAFFEKLSNFFALRLYL